MSLLKRLPINRNYTVEKNIVASNTQGTEDIVERPRTLWRAVCLAAEPILHDGSVAELGAARVPRGMLVEFQKFIAANLMGWSVMLRRYSQATTAVERLTITRNTMAELGMFLARSQFPVEEENHQARTEAMKIFGRALMAGAHFIDIAPSSVGLTPEEIENFAFISRGQRPSYNVSIEAAKEFAAEVSQSIDSLSGFRLAPLMALQMAMFIVPVSCVLAVLPNEYVNNPSSIDGSQYANILDYVIRGVEWLARDTVARSASLEEQLTAGKYDAALMLTSRAGRLKKETSTISQLLKLKPTDGVAQTLTRVLNEVCHAMSTQATHACAEVLSNPKVLEDYKNPEVSRYIVNIATLLRLSASVAKEEEDKTQARQNIKTAKDALMATLSARPEAKILRECLDALEKEKTK